MNRFVKILNYFLHIIEVYSMVSRQVAKQTTPCSDATKGKEVLEEVFKFLKTPIGLAAFKSLSQHKTTIAFTAPKKRYCQGITGFLEKRFLTSN